MQIIFFFSCRKICARSSVFRMFLYISYTQTNSATYSIQEIEQTKVQSNIRNIRCVSEIQAVYRKKLLLLCETSTTLFFFFICSSSISFLPLILLLLLLLFWCCYLHSSEHIQTRTILRLPEHVFILAIGLHTHLETFASCT